MIVVHEKKYLYSDDLKKICKAFSITKQDFEGIVDSL